MKTQMRKSGRATARRVQPIEALLCILSAILLPQIALAGGFTVGSFTSAADLGLDVGFPPPQSLVLAEHGGGNADGQDTVGAVTFTNPATMFGLGTPGHTWGNANFGDAQLNDLVSGVVVGHTIFGQTLSKTFSGLSVGHDYRLRLIVFDGDSSAVNSGQRLSTINAGSDSLGFDYAAIIGGSWVNNKGAYIDYQWTYSSPLTVTWAGNTPLFENPNTTVILSAFTLAELPEPSTALLLGIGGLALFWRRG
jgi:hypothetical protein